MKDLEQYKKENEDLRNELAKVKMELRQVKVSIQALDATLTNKNREAHQLHMQCLLADEDLGEEKKKYADLEAKLAAHEDTLKLVENVA